jgi:CheY-like chemotaxis protein
MANQTGVSPTSTGQGMGLGLKISCQLTRMLGGNLSARSSPGAGSEFTVEIDGGPVEGVAMLTGLTESGLTRNTASDTEALSMAGRQSVGGRILLAEDGLDNQRLISAYLQKSGAQVVVVSNGRQAVEAAVAGGFDLILMDMLMPEMDGYEATAQLRARGIQIPIVALTANAGREDRERCLTTGCCDYLAKPVDKYLLLETIRRNMKPGEAGQTQRREDRESTAISSVAGEIKELIGVINSAAPTPTNNLPVAQDMATGEVDSNG